MPVEDEQNESSGEKAAAAAAAAPPVRFWGTVQAVKPRLLLVKWDAETTPRCQGHLLVVAGTLTPEGEAAQPDQRVTVALGPATQEKRQLRPGDLVRGDALPAPIEGAPDLSPPADLYRVGVFRLIARATSPPPLDPPRTDPPLTPAQAEAAPRRALNPANLEPGGPCAPCPYGTLIPVVRLMDPRDEARARRVGVWRHVPACLGPPDCPYYAPPPPS